jgi:hypothetical protein
MQIALARFRRFAETTLSPAGGRVGAMRRLSGAR